MGLFGLEKPPKERLEYYNQSENGNAQVIIFPRPAEVPPFFLGGFGKRR